MREEFLITRQGKQYVLYAGLLDEWHTRYERYARSIETHLIQAPHVANDQVAIVKATVKAWHHDISLVEVHGTEEKIYEHEQYKFEGIGDASPENVNGSVAQHLIRMAETRAKARALRDAVNVGVTALEELSEGEADEGRGGPQQATQGSQAADLGQRRQRRQGQSAKARKSQVDLLRTLAIEWRGEEGPERLEARLGKKLAELSGAEADEWIERLAPEDREQS